MAIVLFSSSFLATALVLSAPEMPRQSSLLAFMLKGEESPGSTGQGARYRLGGESRRQVQQREDRRWLVREHR